MVRGNKSVFEEWWRIYVTAAVNKQNKSNWWLLRCVWFWFCPRWPQGPEPFFFSRNKSLLLSLSSNSIYHFWRYSRSHHLPLASLTQNFPRYHQTDSRLRFDIIYVRDQVKKGDRRVKSDEKMRKDEVKTVSVEAFFVLHSWPWDGASHRD